MTSSPSIQPLELIRESNEIYEYIIISLSVVRQVLIDMTPTEETLALDLFCDVPLDERVGIEAVSRGWREGGFADAKWERGKGFWWTVPGGTRVRVWVDGCG